MVAKAIQALALNRLNTSKNQREVRKAKPGKLCLLTGIRGRVYTKWKKRIEFPVALPSERHVE